MDIREIEHLWIPLPDGTRLAARLWLPANAERAPVPALLEYLPYRKRDGTAERDSLTHPYLAAHGYACLRVDVRGAGESEGLLSDEYSQAELEDGVALIAWIASQPWCSGRVGMFGISWGGFNALQVAALRPPALKAIVTLCSTDDRYADDVHYMGGAKLESGFGWAAFFFSDMTHPPDPALVGARWRAMWLARLEALPLFLERWLQHQHRDAYWRHGSVCEDWAAIDCAVFAVGGWTDGYTNAIPRLLANLSAPRRGLIGPWAHAYPHFAKPGPQIGFLQEMLKWWDRWLKDRDTGPDSGVEAEPMLRAWMTDSHRPAAHHETLPGRWVSEPAWPPPRPLHRLFLSDAGLEEAPATLTPRPVCSPLSLGKHGGEWCPFGRGNDQADDQREDDALSLVFETKPLTETVELLGAPVLTLELASDKPVAQIIARLCDVHPDGASLRTSFGVLNLTHRDGRADGAGAGRALRRAAAAQRLRCGLSRRPSDPGGAFDRLLADGLAGARARDGDDPRRTPRPAGAASARRIVAGLRAGRDGAGAEVAQRAAGRGGVGPSRRARGRQRMALRARAEGRRSDERRGRDAPLDDRGARRMAHAGRYHPAHELHPRGLPAAGKRAGVRRRRAGLRARLGRDDQTRSGLRPAVP
jgi:putative CocE/NonD family hydrolase